MSSLSTMPGRYLKPLPAVSDENRPFFDALKHHQFVVPRCSDCGHYSWTPHPGCRTCLSDNIGWTPVSGRGTIYSFTVVHRGPGAFDFDVPYVVVLGELIEQPRPCLVLGNLVGTPSEELYIGMPIRLAFEEIPDEDIT